MSPRSPQHERPHALGPTSGGGPRPLHESPAAQRLRSRIPRPPLADSPVPAAPYAVDEAGTEYRQVLPRDVVSPGRRRSSVPAPRHHTGSGAPHTNVDGRAASEDPHTGAGGRSGPRNPHTSAGGHARSGGQPPPSATMPTRGEVHRAGPVTGHTPARRRLQWFEAGKAAVSGRRSWTERTPLTALLEESDTERLPPPSGARRAGTGAGGVRGAGSAHGSAIAHSTRDAGRPRVRMLRPRTGSGTGSDRETAGPGTAPGTRAHEGHPRARTSGSPHPSGPLVEPPFPSGAGTVGELPPSSVTDPDDDLLDGTSTTRLRPPRAPSPQTPGPTGPTHDTGSSAGARNARAIGEATTGAGYTVTEEPPISAELLRHHRGLTPTGTSGADGDLRAFPRSHTDGDLPGPDDTVRLRPRSVGPALPSLEGGTSSPGPDALSGPAFRGTHRPMATFDDMFPGPDEAERLPAPRSPAGKRSGDSSRAHPGPDGKRSGDSSRAHPGPDVPVPGGPASSTTPRRPATRKWVGHRPLGEQPREYRRPSWPVDPPSGEQRSTASVDWPDRDPEDTVTVPDPAPDTAPEGPSHEPQESPWLNPDDEEILKERRPPSGYVEFDTDDAADAPMKRLARWWGPNATLSKRAVIALFVLGAAAVVAALLFLRREPEEIDVPEMVPQAAPDSEDAGDEASEDGTEPAANEDVVVHIGGDVEDPGLYTLPSGARVLDAVEEAGGALPDADLDLVNLARPVADGEQILLGEEVAAEGVEGEGGEDGQRVSLNQADGAALETLPGIGEAKADAILEHRESLGGSFSSIEDLMDVSGIGQSTFDNLEDQLAL